MSLRIRAGFRKILLRGDTRIAENKDLDPWDEQVLPRDGTTSPRPRIWIPGRCWGISASSSDMRPMNAQGQGRRAAAPRVQFPGTTAAIHDQDNAPPATRTAQAGDRPRARLRTIHLLEEMIAEFDYQPGACKKSYRMIVLRKRLAIDKGQMRLFEEYRYFFYITNDRDMSAEDVVFSANDRCNQENLIAQLKSGVHA